MKNTMVKILNHLLHTLLLISLLTGLNAHAGIEITYIHTDALGSPVAGTDEQGNVKWRSQYQPYGEEILGERSAFGVRSGYTGHREDPATGLTYMGVRYYSPALGRFMGMDPAGVDANNIHSFNRYAYANNNPYKFIDPDGRVVETAVDIVSFGLSVAQFKRDPSIANGLGLAYDGLSVAIPFLPGGFGIIKSAGNIADGIGGVTKKAKPLLGKNPKVTKTRTNTDLSGDKATAKSIFRNQTKGQKVKNFGLKKGGLGRRAEDGTQIRFNPNGSTRLDLPNRGPNPPGRETIHIGP